MSKCRYKAKDGECLYEKRFPYKEYCVEGPCPHDTPITNADRIRAMTDEELEAEFWRIYEELRRWTNSRIWLHQWLMEEVKE